MRVPENGWLVCGSRDLGLPYDPKTGDVRPHAGDEYDWMIWVLDYSYERLETPDAIINGAMIGADAISSYWAYRKNIDTLTLGAKWSVGSIAGPRRNRLMLHTFRPKIVFGFCTKPMVEESRGTFNMLSQARKNGVHTMLYSYPSTERITLE